jgi:Asp-tRNA(Asn)/Glu-tRNA(Gln) amidotransferase A subunit family amidase
VAAAFTVFPAEVARVHGLWLASRPDLYGEGTRRLLEEGARTPAAALEAARATREAVRVEVEAAFRDARLDVLASPTLPRAAIPLAAMSPPRDVPAYVPYTAPWNLTGHPALSVPCGFTPDGLPAGLQLVGRPLDEATILRAGHAYQRRTGWHERRPPVARALAAGAPGG